MSSMKTIKGLIFAGVFGLTGLIAGCGGGGAGGAATVVPTPVAATASSVALTTTATSVNSANTPLDFVTITATALSAGNTAMSNQTIEFTSSTGTIIATSPTTDVNGQITARFFAGSLDKTNRTAIIDATVSGTTTKASILIQINGSTLTSSATALAPNVGVAVPLTATTRLSDGSPAGGQALRFSAPSGTLSRSTATTDASGNFSITFTGTASGDVPVLIEWLNSVGDMTASTTQTFTVQAVGAAFEVTIPAISPFPVTLRATQPVTVATPATINGFNVANIRYATTLGTWLSGGLKTLTVARVAASDTQILDAGAFAGNANVQIDALGDPDPITGLQPVLATTKMVLALSASAAFADAIRLQPNVTVLSPSSGGTSSTATLTATVTDLLGNAVGGASVLFELVNPTGSGEQIDPVVVSTNSSGVAQSIFTAGSKPTIQTSTIRASVIGSAAVLPKTTNITVGGTAGSVAIGTSSVIGENLSKTAYQLPVTVMVTDSNGNAVSGAEVSLKIWGQTYYKGTRAALTPCVAIRTFSNDNEDLNENFTLDPGEDVDGPGNQAGLGTADGALWPPSPAAGSLPPPVTTGTDGTATFNWTYLKQYASWITARLRASVVVQGSEATTTTAITLVPSKEDVDACVLSASPFN